MPPHDIAKLWKSTIKVGNTEQPDDPFDLQALNDTGANVTDCFHGRRPIHSGSVEEVRDAPNPGQKCYLIRLNHRPTVLSQVQYRGVAMPANDGQFHKIVGIRKTVFLGIPSQPVTDKKGIEDSKKELAAILAQDEGTWTGTQP